MEWNTILDILKWLIPMGGLSSIVGWLFNRTDRELKQMRESHNAYKAMYEDLNETVKEEINEKKKFRATVAKLERALSKIYGCRYFPRCPVNVELQNEQTGYSKPKQANQRQRGNKRNTGSDAGNRSGVESAIKDTDDEPP